MGEVACSNGLSIIGDGGGLARARVSAEETGVVGVVRGLSVLGAAGLR